MALVYLQQALHFHLLCLGLQSIFHYFLKLCWVVVKIILGLDTQLCQDVIFKGQIFLFWIALVSLLKKKNQWAVPCVGVPLESLFFPIDPSVYFSAEKYCLDYSCNIRHPVRKLLFSFPSELFWLF